MSFPLAFSFRIVWYVFSSLFSTYSFNQDMSGGENLPCTPAEITNETILSKDPEGGGLILHATILNNNFSSVFLFQIVICNFLSLGEKCKGDDDPESLSDIDDVEVLNL
jgi:hypothetical protein